MGSILNFLELLAMVLWTGSIVFFTFFTAPVLFRALGEEEAGKALRILFPRYYKLGIICGLTLVAVQIGRGLLWYWGGMILPATVLFSVLTLAGIYGQRVSSGLSLKLNGFVLLLLLLYLIWMAQRGY